MVKLRVEHIQRNPLAGGQVLVWIVDQAQGG
jgi:hypothetical protein